MYYYRGIQKDDTPYGGGSYVTETGDAHEEYNFCPVYNKEDDKEYCLGFVMPNGKYGLDVNFHLERINGCEALKNEEKVEDVIVVFCARSMGSHTTRVVGFYKNATVYRSIQETVFTGEDGSEDYQCYSFVAEAKDCVLLPFHTRHSESRWYVPHKGENGLDYGFGRNHIYYADKAKENPKLNLFVENMIENIEEYDGENWMYKEVF